MIFKHLFSPGHKSRDPETRIASIAKLKQDLEKDKAILHELAFNDESEKVSLAALEKLNSFALWMKALDTSNSERIKKKAEKTCIQMLEDESEVEDRLFAAYVTESKNKQLQEELLFNSKRLRRDTKLSLSLVLSLQNDNVTRRFFQEVANEEQQAAIIDNIHDAKTLSRFAKYSKSASLKQKIEDMLTRLQEAKDKPIKIKQRATLINSRLLALKEAMDYEYMQQELQKLNAEFESLKMEFSYLDELSSASITEKYLGLKVQIRQKLTDLEGDYNRQKQLSNTTHALSDLTKRCDDIKQQADLLISDSDESHDIDAQSKILTTALQDAVDELSNIDGDALTPAHKKQIKTLNGLILSVQKQLAQSGDILAFLKKAKAVVSSIESALVVYEQNESLQTDSFTQLKNIIAQHKNDFNQIKAQADGLLPDAIVKQFTEAVAKAENIRKRIQNVLKKLEHQCESKLKTVQNMISQGKYKPAMSAFNKAQLKYKSISEISSPRLQRLFETTHQEVAKLKDWQAYIAQPRKPELLEEVKALLASEFEDPYARTEQVKHLRQQWNSLGKLYTKEDDELNDQFDELIEKAFHPCRVFFAEIDKFREENFQKAKAIIDKAKELDTAIEITELTKSITRLKQDFAKIGELERSKKQSIKRDFNKALKPANEKIAEHQQQNILEKQKLVKQAKGLLDAIQAPEDLDEAISSAKQLQQKWKQIGFAGKAADNELWLAFREVNDKLFSQYHDKQASEQSAIASQLKAMENDIVESLKEVRAANELSQLQFYDSRYNELNQRFRILEPHSQKQLKTKLEQLQAAYENAVQAFTNDKRIKALELFFDCLSVYTSESLPDAVDALSNPYKAWFKGETQLPLILDGLDRVELLQVLSIMQNTAHSELKVGSEESRQKLQLALMANKLEGNETINPDDVLAAWVSLGPLNNTDLTLLESLKSLCLENPDNK